jgi:hypothetical protein
MLTVGWKTLSDFLIVFGSILGYVALALEAVIHYRDLKNWIMEPNFQLQMYSKEHFVTDVMVTNTNRKLIDRLARVRCH